MTDAQQIALAIAPTVLPTLTVLVGIMLNTRHVDDLRDEVHKDIRELRDEMRKDIRELREEMRKDLREIREDMREIRGDMKLLTGKVFELDTAMRVIEANDRGESR